MWIMKWLIILLIVNAVTALIYVLIQMGRKKWQRGLTAGLFMLAVPVVGAVFLAISEGINVLLFRKRDFLLDSSELSFNKQRAKTVNAPDIGKSSDQVPVEEALLVSDKKDKRQVFIDLLKKEDYEKSLEVIRQAVEDEDMEISHFASSFISDTVSRYKEQEERLRKNCEDRKEESLVRYAEYLLNMLQYDIFSVPERRTYLERLEGAFNRLEEKESSLITGTMLARAMTLWSKLGEPGKEELLVQTAEKYALKDLEALKICLKYYMKKGEREKFFALLEEVKKSSLTLDGEVLEWLRFYEHK